MGEAIYLFSVYAPEDEALWIDLEKHLLVWERQGLINIWHSGKLLGGQDRAKEIEVCWQQAQIILLLVSANLLASEEYRFIEQAMKRHQAGNAWVVPIVLRSVNWQGSLFERLQMLPINQRPVTLWKDRSQALSEVARGIREVIGAILSGRTQAEHVPDPEKPSKAYGASLPSGIPHQTLTTAERARATHIRISNTLGDGHQEMHLGAEASADDVQFSIGQEPPHS